MSSTLRRRGTTWSHLFLALAVGEIRDGMSGGSLPVSGVIYLASATEIPSKMKNGCRGWMATLESSLEANRQLFTIEHSYLTIECEQKNTNGNPKMHANLFCVSNPRFHALLFGTNKTK